MALAAPSVFARYEHQVGKATTRLELAVEDVDTSMPSTSLNMLRSQPT
jgi:hypothetical protein